ncbi:MAG: S46 family peptidase [Candidatus Krumholzibacteria bacterium]|nr:S46 family peptidase [Candidatus Krumholzibacteria bacterium]
MRARLNALLCAAIIMAVPAMLVADEGMWPIDNLDRLSWNDLRAMGLQLSSKQIYDGKGGGVAYAIVSLGGGTGSFVSPNGLILTNHHVAFGALQRTSTAEHNYTVDGFNAASYEEEVPAPGYRASVLLSIEDVTRKVLSAVNDSMGDLERFNAIEKRIKEIVKYGEEGRDVECRVVSFFEGMQYKLFTYFVSKDVRIVYAPPASIGNYGGDIDNWMWPRHTGDFSFLRAYVAPDGKSAEYAKENVPYRPAVHLAMSTKSVKENDFTMIIGYPGRTGRYATSLEKKRNTEQAFSKWLEMSPDMKKKYGDVLPAIGSLYEEQKGYRDKNMIVGQMNFGCQMLRAAGTLDHWTEEKTKSDIERKPGYQDRDVPRLKQSLRMIQMSYDPQVDRRVLRYFLMRAIELPENQRIETVDAALEGAKGPEAEKKIDALLDKLYAGTKLGSPEERLRMFDLSREDLLKAGDSFVDFAVKLDKEAKALEDRDKTMQGALQRLSPRLMEAFILWKGGNLYPDANGTMRLTYGTAKGYNPRDAVSYRYMTSLAGVVEKNTGEDPFDCPKELLALHESLDFGAYEDAALGDVPVDFLSTCDITGGNSGSPIMNGKGECIGAAFDGNYESISSDYLFIKETTRSINVDSRYILFIMDKMSGAKRLLDEMKVR